MKKRLSIAVGLIMMLGIMPVFAAQDVTISPGTLINVGSYNFEITGSSDKVVDSLTVTGTTMAFTLSPGDGLTVSSSDRRKFSYSVDAGITVTTVCSSLSQLGLLAASSNASSASITITPSDTEQCDTTAASSGSGSGGGGGGTAGGNNPNYNLFNTSATQSVTAPSVQLPAQASATAVAATTAASVAHTFRTYLKLGSMGTDVTELQKKLTEDGVYSGPVTGYFGSLTQAAVKKYQAKYQIDQLGVVGPATRAQLNSSPVSAVVQAAKSSEQTVEALTAQLQALQAQLLQLLNQKLQGMQ